MAVLYTTHYMEEAERLCDRVGIIDDGALIAEGTRRELVALVGERDRVASTRAGDLGGGRGRRRIGPGVDTAVTPGHGVGVWSATRGRRCRECARWTLMGPASDQEVREPDLEAVFLHLTGKALRDEG